MGGITNHTIVDFFDKEGKKGYLKNFISVFSYQPFYQL